MENWICCILTVQIQNLFCDYFTLFCLIIKWAKRPLSFSWFSNQISTTIWSIPFILWQYHPWICTSVDPWSSIKSSALLYFISIGFGAIGPLLKQGDKHLIFELHLYTVEQNLFSINLYYSLWLGLQRSVDQIEINLKCNFLLMFLAGILHFKRNGWNWT